jgi:hypothetical protein
LAFTYTPGGTTRLNRLRAIIGDTDSSNPLLQDEELLAELALQRDPESGLFWAAGSVFDQLLARFAPQPDEIDRDNDTAVKWRQRISTWELLAKNSRARASELERKEQAAQVPPSQPEAGRMNVDVGWIR